MNPLDRRMVTEPDPKFHEIVVRLPRQTQKLLIGRSLDRHILGAFDVGYSKTVIFWDPALPSSAKKYLDLLQAVPDVFFIEVPDAEACKSTDFVTSQASSLASLGLDRSGCLIGLGGGGIGDAVGFLAATYLRGIDFIYLPTTLMGQADAIINKVAVNVGKQKNLLGAFYSPVLVLCDTDFLQSVSAQAISHGLSEIIKHGIVGDRSILASLARHEWDVPSVSSRSDQWSELIGKSLSAKVRLVRDDPLDRNGQQKGLSLGHTFANAFESITNFRMHHGEAVALGIVAATHLAESYQLVSGEYGSFIRLLLDRAGLPATLPEDVGIDEIIALLRRDKISVRGGIYLVLPSERTGFEVRANIPEADVRRALSTLA